MVFQKKEKKEDEEKHKGDAGFKARFSMGEFDYRRIHIMCCNLNNYAFEVNNGEYHLARSWLNLLRETYDSMFTLLHKKDQRQIEKDIDEAERGINYYEQTELFKRTTLLLLRKIHHNIFKLKQESGMGIEVKREMSAERQMKERLDIL